ncbi:MAG: chemotaxis protein CheA [Brevinemataceae bacterium]
MSEWNNLLKDFFDEAYMLLNNFEESLLNLEKNLTDPNSIATVFRVAHTIKGGAGAVGLKDIVNITHILEDILDLVRNHKYLLTQNDITLLLKVKDELEKLLNVYENNQKPNNQQIRYLIETLEHFRNNAGQIPSSPNNSNTKYKARPTLPIAARFGLTNELLKSIRESLDAGEPLFFIEINFNQEYELKEVAPIEITALIGSFAEPFIMNPSPESLDYEYTPFLNIVISSTEPAEYIKNKLQLPNVIEKISVTPLTYDFYTTLKKSMFGEIEENAEPFSSSNNKNQSQKTNTAQKIFDDIHHDFNEPTHPSQIIDKRSTTLKVDSSRIDELLNLLGELVIVRSGFSQFESELEKSIQDMRYSLRNFLSSSTTLALHEDKDQNKQRNEFLRESFTQISNGFDKYLEYQQQLSRISSILQTQMMTLRMVPIQSVFSRFIRLTRDIAAQLDKKIELIIEGGETEIDKGMIGSLYDPLLHMIRNSLDHGIEPPSERIKIGKPEVGIIRLKAYQEGDSILIEISDDGRGIDPNKIRQKAIALGLATEEEVAHFSKQEIFSLIFKPGFSTAVELSDLSGRGVGMDVVNRTIQDLGGTVSIYSDKGLGTTMKIQLPLTLAIIQGLLIIVGGINYVIPIASVEETVMLNIIDLKRLSHYYALEFRGQLIPLIPLSLFLYGIDTFEPLFNEENTHPSHEVLQRVNHDKLSNYRDYCVIIIRYANRQVGIVVPEILGEQDIVIKALDNKLVYSPGLAAATIVGNGEIGYILDIPQIIRHHLKKNNNYYRG